VDDSSGDLRTYNYVSVIDEGLTWGGQTSCGPASLGYAEPCDDQVIIDINGESYHQAFRIDRDITAPSKGYLIRLDYTDLDAPGPETGDVVTIKMAAGAFRMPADTTNYVPFLEFNNIQVNGQNGALQSLDEGTVLSPLPPSPDDPAAPTATAGVEEATVTITPNTSGETVTTYRITSSPGGATCDITPPDTSCIVTGLQGGTAYTFTAVALNAGFPSGASPASNSVTPESSASEPSEDTGGSEESPAVPELVAPAEPALAATGVNGSFASLLLVAALTLGALGATLLWVRRHAP
jgi:hypothetical protein